MGRSKLTRAIFILTMVYVGGAYIWFFMMPPHWVVEYYTNLPGWMKVVAAPDSQSLGSSAEWQLLMLSLWSLPVLMAWCLLVALGLGLSWMFLSVGGKRFRRRGAPGSGVGECFWTMGDLLGRSLPHPIKPVRVRIKGIKFTPEQQELADEMLGLIATKPDTFAGDGHGVGLYEHTLNLLELVGDLKNPDPMLALAAIGHDMGKLLAYKKIGKTWQRISDHGIQSGRLIKVLPAYHAMDQLEAEAIHAAVRYSHRPDHVPVNLECINEANRLIEGLKKLDGNATKKEKEELLAARDMAGEITALFWEKIGGLPFYRRGRRRNEKTIGWRYGKRLYLNEPALRDTLLELLDRDVSAALGKFRRGGKVHVLTQNLMAELDKQGVLVREVEHEGIRYELPPEAALWSIQSGNTVFNGVFIIEPTPGQGYIPPEEAPFKVYAMHPATTELRKLATETVIDPDKAASNKPAKESKPKKDKAATPKTKAGTEDPTPKKPKVDKRGPGAKESVLAKINRDRAERGAAAPFGTVNCDDLLNAGAATPATPAATAAPEPEKTDTTDAAAKTAAGADVGAAGQNEPSNEIIDNAVAAASKGKPRDDTSAAGSDCDTKSNDADENKSEIDVDEAKSEKTEAKRSTMIAPEALSHAAFDMDILNMDDSDEDDDP